MSVDIITWFFAPKVWTILGIILIAGDIFLGYSLFILPVGIAALILAALLFAQQELIFGDMVLFSTWHAIGITFAILSVGCILALRFIFQRKKDSEPDINEY
ncbi:MAG: hypothetical protein R3261_09325 [Alphaproteobacteria bacterium]|nr:hypothetical protein [Alphaproteobacteria bacterium]